MFGSGHNERQLSPNRCAHMKKFHLERTNEALVGQAGLVAVGQLLRLSCIDDRGSLRKRNLKYVKASVAAVTA